ncbi:MAG: alpha/beta fold hydrolase [Myxococcales bacterium]|nr:alpha/beta fold hydrolase [Myxococcales bacterium]
MTMPPWIPAVLLGLAACNAPDAPPGGATGTGSSTSPGESTDAASADETGTGIGGEGTSSGSSADESSSGDQTTGEPLLGPPYPIVLAHGFFGFEELANLPFVPYWYDVREHLEALGHTVCVSEVDPFNDSTDRGTQLVAQALECADQTGHAKVNVIGHSQGGLDARVAASLAPDRIASVTTVATPHQGTPIADIALGLVASDGAAALVDWLVQTLGAPLWDEVGNETSLAEALYQMSHDPVRGIDVFNATYPDAPGVLYTSVTGRTGLHSGGEDCEPDSPPPPLLISDWDDTLDTTDTLLLVPEAILSDGIFSQTPNDGLVRVVDARWGEFLGCVPADHLDEVGQLLGDSPGLGNGWDHLAFYADLVAYLRARDL